MTNPNNRSIASTINQLMNSDPRRFAEWMNSGACLGTLDQIAQDQTNAQQSPHTPYHANYSACVNLNERLLGEMGGGTEPVVYQCRYDRERARQYALQWGSSDAFKDATPGMIVGVGTDCANFASQVLAAGGFRPTNNWYYTRNPETGYIQDDRSPSWAGVDWLLSWLTGAPYSDKSDLTPLALTSDAWIDVRVHNIDSVVDAARQAGNLRIGDLIFYYDSLSVGEEHNHVAIVVGEGSPYSYESEGIRRVASDDKVPWIVDHGQSFYYNEGRMRPYNHQKPYNGIIVGVKFVHIPDNFRLDNIWRNGLWE